MIESCLQIDRDNTTELGNSSEQHRFYHENLPDDYFVATHDPGVAVVRYAAVSSVFPSIFRCVVQVWSGTTNSAAAAVQEIRSYTANKHPRASGRLE